jgi:hypothetical protein
VIHAITRMPRRIRFTAVWEVSLLERACRSDRVCSDMTCTSYLWGLGHVLASTLNTAPDRCRYLDAARGSALECAACLDVLVAKGQLTPDQVRDGKAVLHETVCLLVGLIRSMSPERLREEPLPDRTSGDI